MCSRVEVSKSEAGIMCSDENHTQQFSHANHFFYALMHKMNEPSGVCRLKMHSRTINSKLIDAKNIKKKSFTSNFLRKIFFFDEINQVKHWGRNFSELFKCFFAFDSVIDKTYCAPDFFLHHWTKQRKLLIKFPFSSSLSTQEHFEGLEKNRAFNLEFLFTIQNMF